MEITEKLMYINKKARGRISRLRLPAEVLETFQGIDICLYDEARFTRKQLLRIVEGCYDRGVGVLRTLMAADTIMNIPPSIKFVQEVRMEVAKHSR